MKPGLPRDCGSPSASQLCLCMILNKICIFMHILYILCININLY